MENLHGKTAKEITALVQSGEVDQTAAVEHMLQNGAKRVAKGRKPTFPSLKALEAMTGKPVAKLREEINAIAGVAAPQQPKKSTKRKATKPSANHAQLDGLTVAFVEADVLKLVDSRTTKAAITRMHKGMIKDPLKVANLREAERRLGLVQPEPERMSTSERIDGLESAVTEILNLLRK